MQIIDEIDSDWLVIVPTVQLTVSNDPPINGSWRVGDVTFMSKEAMIAYLRPPNLPSELDTLRLNDLIPNPIMAEHQSFALIKQTGNPKEIRKTVFHELREATHVLASTNAMVSKRSNMQGFTLHGLPIVIGRKDLFLDLIGKNSSSNLNLEGMLMPFELDDVWHKAVTESGMINLFDRIIDPNLDPSWRRQIKSGAAMLGKSLMTLERADAFLLDVMGLETILTVKRERNGDKLAQRIKGMVGWHLRGNRPSYVDEIKNIHEVRCEIVHDSDFSNLTTELLLKADIYLVNSLLNIVSLPGLFPDKDAMIAVVDSYATTENWPSDGSVPFRWIGDSNFNSQDLDLPLW